MKRFLSLKTLVWLAGIAFGFMIVISFINEFDDCKMGFYSGSASYIADNQLADSIKSGSDTVGDTEFRIAPDVYFIKLAPKESVFSFPDSIENIKTKNKISTRYFRMKAALPISVVLPSKVKVYDGFQQFLSLVIAAMYIFLIVKLLVLLSSLKQEIVFDKNNIRQLRLMGIALILIYVFMSFFNYLSFLVSNILFEFEHYKILYDKADTIHLFLGVVILIVAEMINRGMKLKHENELTI